MAPGRAAFKAIAGRLLGDGGYSWLQAAAMSWDVMRGTWAEPEVDLIPLCVAAGDTAIDVGAHYGMWTRRLSAAVGVHGTVLAFEPVPFTFSTLAKVCRLLRLRNVRLVPAGCSDAEGLTTLVVPLQANGAISAGQAHVSWRDDERPGRERHVRHERSTSVEVDMIRLDDVACGCSSVSLLKVDVEGWELGVLRGGEGVISVHHPTIVAEINPWFLEGLGQTPGDIADFLSGHGYAMYHYEKSLGCLLAVDPADAKEANYVFVHPSRRAGLIPLLSPAT